MSNTRVTIVGAGLAGSLLAIFFSRRGIAVDLHEQTPDPREEAAPAGRSINLALAERGLHALESVDLRKAVMDFAIPMQGRMVHALDGQSELQPYSARTGAVIYAVHREKLNRLLLDTARSQSGVNVHFNSKLIGGDLDKSRLNFRNDNTNVVETVTTAPVIGADGAGSVLRELVDEASGQNSRSDLLDHSYKELTIPPDPDGKFRVEPNALHIWPRGGYMLIALPNHDQSFTATLFLPNEGEPAFGTLKDPRAVKQFFQHEFPDTIELIPALEDEFFQRPTGVLGTVRCPQWHVNDRALLLGDAAHAIVPFHGQGMNCAFEDCEYLDQLIGQHGTRWDRVFADFENERRTNADAIAEMALENYLEMRDAVRDPAFKRKKELERVLEQRHPDRFIPRYSMVMFRRIPYREAYRRGAIQDAILNQLLRERGGEPDLELADHLIHDRLPSLNTL